jgi:iron(II)-dependent oxidoreductase
MNEVIPVHNLGDTMTSTSAEAMRKAGPAEIEAALTRGRTQLLSLFDGFERGLGPNGLRIAQDTAVNLPLWELGHIGWFEEFWLSRNTERGFGIACDPFAPRRTSVLPRADALYDSSNVAHGLRWQLALPDPSATRSYLTAVREATLTLLRACSTKEEDLYFFRLVLFHEDMHREAWHFMAQRLGIDLGPGMTGRAPRPAVASGSWDIPGGLRHVGVDNAGFAFDNELCAANIEVSAFSIDRATVKWDAFLAFVDGGGYTDDRTWTPAGRDWRRHSGATHPLHLRRGHSGWERSRFGRWLPIDPLAPAVQITAHEAEAWCRWAGRRLPTEAEWETAAKLAVEQGEVFEWGEVWEWTASPFEPYSGFVPHPYRDYSQPWFDGRSVLRGGSFATVQHMKHPSYRNFFPADRSDVFAGFRSCPQRSW